jgi:hypothetical protein
MKRPAALMCLILLPVLLFPQDLKQQYSDILQQIGKEIPSDQVFLHPDRNRYSPGDTIWFQAYIRDSRTGVLTTESSALYVLLLDDHRSTLDSARFRIMYSTVSGWLRVPEGAGGGTCSILAFTSIGMNYSPEYAYTVPVLINGRQDEKQPSGPGSNIGSSPVAPLSPLPSLPEMKFLPEGGTFIAGVPQRLAFNAVRTDGKNVKVSGWICNQKDKKLVKFESGKYGPGLIEFTPSVDDSYYAVLDGKEYLETKWTLPFPEKKGIALRVISCDTGYADIIVRGRGQKGSSCFLTMTMNNILLFSELISPDTIYRKRVLTDRLPSGTAFVTVYDTALNPVAERLVFINSFRKLNISTPVSGKNAMLGSETELTIRTTDNNGLGVSSLLSVAVIDSTTGFFNGLAVEEIASAWLYDKTFLENIPFGIRAAGLSSLDSRTVDLLLMTYGWRTFHPKDITLDSTELELADYDAVMIENPGPPKKSRSDILLINDANADLLTLPLGEEHKAELPFDSLNQDARQIMILPDKIPQKNMSPVNVLFPVNKQFTGDAKALGPEKSLVNHELPDSLVKKEIYGHGNIVVIEEVTIKAPAKPKEIYKDRYSKMYQYAGTRTLTSDDFKSAGTFEDILYKANPYFFNANSWQTDPNSQVVYLRANERSGKAEYNEQGQLKGYEHKMLAALFVVDNNPIGNDYQAIAGMSADDIVSITIMPGAQGYTMYGHKAQGGVIFVTTKMAARLDGTYVETKSARTDDLLKQIRLFRSETEFYLPPKELVTAMPEYQYRPTILWKADLVTDETGSVTLNYPNNLHSGTVMIFINGVSSTDCVGSERLSYKVF